MGEMIYGAGDHYEFDDRTLAHIQMAVGTKLRRQESCSLSWVNPKAATPAERRVRLWIAPPIALQFHYFGSRIPTINPIWLRAIEETASGDSGLFLIDEGEAEAFLRSRLHPKSS